MISPLTSAHDAPLARDLPLKLVRRTGVPHTARICVVGDETARTLQDAGYANVHVARRPAAPACQAWIDVGAADDFGNIALLRGSLLSDGWAILACCADRSSALLRALGRDFRRRETHLQRRADARGLLRPFDFHVIERTA